MTTPVNGWPGRFEVMLWDTLNEELETSRYFDHVETARDYLVERKNLNNWLRGQVVDHAEVRDA